MGTPGQDIINQGLIGDPTKARWNRAGVPVEGHPGFITVSDPPDSYAGAEDIDSPERVDLVISRRDNSRLSLRYRVFPDP